MANLKQFEGTFKGVPAFFVAHHYLGYFGLSLFAIALFAIVATSVIGNVYGLAGLISTMARNKVLPDFLAKNDKNDNHIPAILFITGITFVMLFFGDVLIKWIVDVNNICGTIVFSYIGVVTIAQAKKTETIWPKQRALSV